MAAILAAAAGHAQAEPACREDRVQLRGEGGQAAFTVEVADDRSERNRGLMNRETLPRGAGMLFVYETPRPVSFWMKNTLIPLDMIFLDSAGRVVKVHEMARPLSTERIVGGDAVQYVLEINGGLAGPLGIGEGSVLRHPAVDQEAAAWPC
ncbi:DUF192 domain-containing protein [Roseovarius sp. SCSIO 43702]|uniref:DUF192 domain-containing protein n=1 Tax=Roseovarius sp. SCSIO 43702 TaxID=2823043 RepID=UPI002175AA67|nr:DUF192 domain-containing protein [Roseovarius sp. SCSIO 43702]